jgi:DNA mismatch repair protein MutS
VVEYLCDKQNAGAKTLFATHYHELSELEGRLSGVQTTASPSRSMGGRNLPAQDHKGGADKSFGCCGAAGRRPAARINAAYEIRLCWRLGHQSKHHRAEHSGGEQKNGHQQVGLFNYAQTELIEERAALM